MRVEMLTVVRHQNHVTVWGCENREGEVDGGGEYLRLRFFTDLRAWLLK